MEEEAPKKRRGRPVDSARAKYKPETCAKVIRSVRLGMTFGDAANRAGISSQALYDWLRKGREGDKRFTPFSDEMDRAINEAKEHHLKFINKHAEGGFEVKKRTVETDAAGAIVKIIEVVEQTPPNLRASQWLLERRHPAEFGAKQEVAVVNGGNPFEVSLFGLAAIPGSTGDMIDDEGNGESA